MVSRRLAAVLLATTTAAGCSPGRDVHDAFNSRDTGPYLPVGRAIGADGSLLVHVVAHRPDHAEEIARHIVRQNYATGASGLRIVVDPTHDGSRQVFRWDGKALQPDHSAEGLPPAPAQGE
ncbi:MAG TPA: hypothetical protein VMF13_13505, partial [Luteitalea sp.]|nr:hypothetical protein [Luteitalea sp.]